MNPMKGSNKHLVMCLAIALCGSCASARDGSATKSACLDYAAAANACWNAATGEDALDPATCEEIDADIDTALIESDSSCGLKNLADIYACCRRL